MNPQLTPLLAAVILVLAMIVFMVIALSRYMKVGPNQVLIVSGRKVHLPDGRCVGFRLVKGGGTFVFPKKLRSVFYHRKQTHYSQCLPWMLRDQDEVTVQFAPLKN
jgi:hypothetical protein